ncbi:MAG: hypothetical protein AWM53_00001 [Candidatus Dichloromethanomonas elyunquensis]|nr:MAG: hypothetical protein AWM53_00001 [Candidatus Dichloromethanomonas elyunquensis]
MSCFPDLYSRAASASFFQISDSETITIGSRIYSFRNNLGKTPATGNVDIKLQNCLEETVKLLAKAVRGESDINISYALGESNNPECQAYWTRQKFCLGTVQVNAGQNLFILQKKENANEVINLETISGYCSINYFRDLDFLRYVIDKEDVKNKKESVRGSYQMILPISLLGFKYEIDRVEKLYSSIDLFRRIEIDFYKSPDEINFTWIRRDVIFTGSLNSIRICSLENCISLLEKQGLYVRVGVNGIDRSNYVDLQITFVEMVKMLMLYL